MISEIINIVEKTHFPDYASVLGLLITIVGFIVTIYNVIKSKNASILAEETVNNVRTDLRLYQTVSGFSNAIAIMDEVKRLHRQKEWKLLPDRYSNLRKSLISIRFNNPILSEQEQKEIQSSIAQFSGLEKLIDEYLLSENPKEINIPKINSRVSKQIDRIQQILVNLSNKIGTENEL